MKIFGGFNFLRKLECLLELCANFAPWWPVHLTHQIFKFRISAECYYLTSIVSSIKICPLVSTSFSRKFSPYSHLREHASIGIFFY